MPDWDKAGANRIAVVLLPNFSGMATAALIDPFRVANYLRGPDVEASALYHWTFLTLDGRDGANFTASNGLQASAASLAETTGETFDFVILSASWAPERYRDPTLFAWLRRQAGRGAALGGLDTGAFLLGFAGLLDGYTATVHYEHLAAFEELFPKVTTSDALYVIDRNRLTASGGLAACDLALTIIGRQMGPSLANAASRYLLHDRIRPASEQQSPSRREPLGVGVPAALRAATALMEASLEDPRPIDEIAAAAKLSQRQLQRLFQRHAGMSPARYYLDCRLDRARGMVTQTDMSVLEISVACGFSSPEYMTKCYRERFAVTPSADRVLGRVPFQFRDFPNYALRRAKPNRP